MGVGGQRHAPAALPPGKTRYPLYRRLGGRQSRSGRVRKISPPPGFDRRTVQPVASRCPGSPVIFLYVALNWNSVSFSAVFQLSTEKIHFPTRTLDDRQSDINVKLAQ